MDAAACRLPGSPGAPSSQHALTLALALALGQPASSCCPGSPRATRRWNGWDLIYPRPGDGGISVPRQFGWQTTHARSGRAQQHTAGYPTLPCRTICVDPRSPRSRPRGHPHTEPPPSCFPVPPVSPYPPRTPVDSLLTPARHPVLCLARRLPSPASSRLPLRLPSVCRPIPPTFPSTHGELPVTTPFARQVSSFELPAPPARHHGPPRPDVYDHTQ